MLLVVSMMTLTLLTALCGAMVLGTVAERAIAASYREGHETFYAAEAIAEFAVQALDQCYDLQICVLHGKISPVRNGCTAPEFRAKTLKIALS